MPVSESRMRELHQVTLHFRILTKPKEGQRITLFMCSDDFPQKFAEWLETKAHVKSTIGVVFQSDSEIRSNTNI